MNETTKKCPICSEEIKIEDRICPFCKARFDITFKGYCAHDHQIVEADEQGGCPICHGTLLDTHVNSELIDDAIVKTDTPSLSVPIPDPNMLPVPEEPTLPIPVTTDMNDLKPAEIQCHKCSTINPTTAIKCQYCGSDLLPGTSKVERLTALAVTILGTTAFTIGAIVLSSKPNVKFWLPLCSGILAISMLVSGISVLFAKKPPHQRYYERAKRHLKLNPHQAIADLTKASEFAPSKEKGKYIMERTKLHEQLGMAGDIVVDMRALIQVCTETLVTATHKAKADILEERAGLYAKLSMEEHSTRDLLEATNQMEIAIKNGEFDASKGVENIGSLLTGAGDAFAAGFTRENVKQATVKIYNQRSQLIKEGRIIAVGYCPKCKDVVVLNIGRVCEKCGSRPKHKEAIYSMPADLEQTKTLVRQKNGISRPSQRDDYLPDSAPPALESAAGATPSIAAVPPTEGGAARSRVSGICMVTAVTKRQLIGLTLAKFAMWLTFTFAVVLSLQLFTKGASHVDETELFSTAWSYVHSPARIAFAYPPITLWIGFVMFVFSENYFRIEPVNAIRIAKRRSAGYLRGPELQTFRDAVQNLTRQLHERGFAGLIQGNVRLSPSLTGAGLVLVTALLAPKSIEEGYSLLQMTGQKAFLPTMCMVGSLIGLVGLLLSFPYGSSKKVVVDILGNVHGADEPFVLPSVPPQEQAPTTAEGVAGSVQARSKLRVGCLWVSFAVAGFFGLISVVALFITGLAIPRGSALQEITEEEIGGVGVAILSVALLALFGLFCVVLAQRRGRAAIIWGISLVTALVLGAVILVPRVDLGELMRNTLGILAPTPATAPALVPGSTVTVMLTDPDSPSLTYTATPRPTPTKMPTSIATPLPVEVTFDTIGNYPIGQQVILVGRIALMSSTTCSLQTCGLLLENPAKPSQKMTIFVTVGTNPNQMKPLPDPYTKSDIQVYLNDGSVAVVNYRIRITGRVCTTESNEPCISDIVKIELFQVK